MSEETSTPELESTDSFPEEMEKFKKISIEDISGTDKKSQKAAKKSLYSDRNLELLGMSRKEKKEVRKAAYRENTKAMSTKEKCAYFFDYYKWYVIIPLIIVLFTVYLSFTIYQNKRPVALGFAILNTDAETVNLSFEDDYINYFNIEGRYQFKESTGRDIDYDYYLKNSDYIQTSNSTDYNIIISECELGTYDVIISNKTGVMFCTTENVARPLKGYLESDIYEKLEPYMVKFPDHNGSDQTYAINISGTDFAKSLNLSYSDVYVIFPGNTEVNYTNSLRLIEYALGIKLTE